MNSLAHILGMLASVWLAIYCFNTLDEVALGVATLGLFFLFATLLIFAVADDVDIIHGRRGKE